MRGRSQRLWWGTAIEAPDPTSLAAFYSELLDWPVVHQEPTQTVLKPSQDGVYMIVQLAQDYVPPVWPLALGATVVDVQPQENVRVMLDPVGHPFCLCRDDG